MDNTFIFKNDRPWPNPRMKRAVIVGHTTATSTRLWVRTAQPGDYTLLLYPGRKDKQDNLYEGFKSVPYDVSVLPPYVRTLSFSTDFETDTTHVLDIDDLEPLTEYRYALYGTDEAGNSRILLGQDQRYRFRTMPEAAAPLSFAFFSCHMPYDTTLFGQTETTSMAIWECLNETLERYYQDDLRFVIGGGDQVYTDGVDTLNIWEFLNKTMCRQDGALLPTQDDMVSWYRDIYRGYWGFGSVRKVFANYPTYMIWDDHELGDGWGSYIFRSRKKDDELKNLFPDYTSKGLRRRDCFKLLERMEAAGKRVYREYQHAHNPETPAARFDYSMQQGETAFYFLDGRGYRDVNRDKHRILGTAQLRRFRRWVRGLDVCETPYVFIVSAVPILHVKPWILNKDESFWARWRKLEDDLRDGWEHDMHEPERKALLRILFDAAEGGFRVCIVSGDVHTSAAFRIKKPNREATIYQLTASAITYNNPLWKRWILGQAVPEQGRSSDGYDYERLALYTDSNFSTVSVNPESDELAFHLFGKQEVSNPETGERNPVSRSIAKIKLTF